MISKISNVKIVDLKNWKDYFHVGSEQENLFNVDTSLGGIANTIRVLLQVVIGGLIAVFVFMVVYGAFTWTTAGDNEEKLAKAKKILKNGVIGLFMVIGFLLILGFISYILGIKIIGVTFNFGEEPTT